MPMRFHNSAHDAARLLKSRGIEPTPDRILGAMLAEIDSLASKDGRERHRQLMLKAGVFLSDENLSLTVVKSLMAMLHEYLAATKSVVIHVDDAQLVDALARTDIDALISDVKLPFPLMEFVWPDRPACLIVDVSHPDVLRESSAIVSRFFGGRRVPASHGDRIEVHSRTKDDCPRFLQFNKDIPLLEQRGLSLAPQQDLDEMWSVTRLAMACLLYAQTAPGVMRPSPRPMRQDGVPSALAALAKKRAHYVIRDLYGSSRPACSTEANTTGRIVAGHWRRGHMRSLRSDRFARNPDGSIKIVWIRPCQIHPEAIIREQDRRIR